MTMMLMVSSSQLAKLYQYICKISIIVVQTLKVKGYLANSWSVGSMHVLLFHKGQRSDFFLVRPAGVWLQQQLHKTNNKIKSIKCQRHLHHHREINTNNNNSMNRFINITHLTSRNQLTLTTEMQINELKSVNVEAICKRICMNHQCMLLQRKKLVQNVLCIIFAEWNPIVFHQFCMLSPNR